MSWKLMLVIGRHRAVYHWETIRCQSRIKHLKPKCEILPRDTKWFQPSLTWKGRLFTQCLCSLQGVNGNVASIFSFCRLLGRSPETLSNYQYVLENSCIFFHGCAKWLFSSPIQKQHLQASVVCVHAVIHGLLVEGHNDISNKFKAPSIQEGHCGTTSHHTLEMKVTNQALSYGFV